MAGKLSMSILKPGTGTNVRVVAVSKAKKRHAKVDRLASNQVLIATVTNIKIQSNHEGRFFLYCRTSKK